MPNSAPHAAASATIMLSVSFSSTPAWSLNCSIVPLEVLRHGADGERGHAQDTSNNNNWLFTST